MTADFTAASLAIGAARSLEELLRLISDQSRRLVGAHQAATSLLAGGKWTHALHAVSLSDRYAAWRNYDETPDGSGIYHLVCRLNRPIRLAQAELQAHPAWQGFGAAAERHPPMRGWLAVPLVARTGRNIGLIQLSDRHDGEFSEADEATLVAWAGLASRAIEETRQRARARRRVE